MPVRTGSSRDDPASAHAILSAAPNTLYAGDGGSCYSGQEPPPAWLSTNSGAAWQQLPAAAGLKPLAAHPSNPKRLYLGVCGGPFLTRTVASP